MTNKKLLIPIVTLVIIATSLSVTAASVSAATNPSSSFHSHRKSTNRPQNLISSGKGKHAFVHGVTGTVSEINGNLITVQSKNSSSTPITAYVVDASNAKILKKNVGSAPSVSTISAIQVGDIIKVRGTVNGASVTATNITDGMNSH